jgi:cysteine synthase A
VGISSGANLVGAIRLHQRMGRDRAVVTIFPDDNKKYVSTDLFRQESVQPGYVSPEVELLSYRVLTNV